MLNVGERAGSGIPNIYHVWKEQGWQEPVLEERFNPDRTILSLVLSQQENKKVAIKNGELAISNVQKQIIVDYLTSHKMCTTKELADLFDVTQARVRVLLSQLVESGIVVTEGANRNRIYRLK
jgi:predicted HTH transcriptional regulator